MEGINNNPSTDGTVPQASDGNFEVNYNLFRRNDVLQMQAQGQYNKVQKLRFFFLISYCNPNYYHKWTQCTVVVVFMSWSPVLFILFCFVCLFAEPKAIFHPTWTIKIYPIFCAGNSSSLPKNQDYFFFKSTFTVFLRTFLIVCLKVSCNLKLLCSSVKKKTFCQLPQPFPQLRPVCHFPLTSESCSFSCQNPKRSAGLGILLPANHSTAKNPSTVQLWIVEDFVSHRRHMHEQAGAQVLLINRLMSEYIN